MGSSMVKESGLKEKERKSEFLKGTMLRARRKDMVNSNGQVATFIEVSIRMMNVMDMEKCIGSTIVSTKVLG